MVHRKMDELATAIRTSLAIRVPEDQLPDSFSSSVGDQWPGVVDANPVSLFQPQRPSLLHHMRRQEKEYGSAD
jgi:hypothetical protein